MKALKVLLLGSLGLGVKLAGSELSGDKSLQVARIVSDELALDLYQIDPKDHQSLIRMNVDGAGCVVISAHPDDSASLQSAINTLDFLKKNQSKAKVMLVLDDVNGSGMTLMDLPQGIQAKFEKVLYHGINSKNSEGVDQVKEHLFNLAAGLSDSSALTKKSSINWPRIGGLIALSILTVGLLPLALVVIGAIKTKSFRGMLDYVRDTFSPKAKFVSQYHEISGHGVKSEKRSHAAESALGLGHGSPAVKHWYDPVVSCFGHKSKDTPKLTPKKPTIN